MESLLLVARLLLAGVFTLAGAAKLADLAGTRRAIAGFGVPGTLAGPLALALPMAELAVAVALLPRRSAWCAALAAFVLLLAFLVAILFNLAKGRKPDCRCFGQLRAAPIGASTVALNVGLLAVSGLCVWYGPGASIVALIGDLSQFERVAVAGGVAALIAIAAFAVLLRRMLQQQQQMLARLTALESRLAGQGAGPPAKFGTQAQSGLPVGAKAPAFALEALGGGTVTLDDLLAGGKPVLLVFTDPDCGPCEDMLPDLARWQRDHAITIAVVSSGTAEENQAVGVHGLRHVLLQWKYEVADAYQCERTPAGVIVRPDGTIGSLVCVGSDAIAQLVASTTGQNPKPPRIASTIFLRSRGG